MMTDLGMQTYFHNGKASDIISCFAAAVVQDAAKTTVAGEVAEWSNALDSKSSVRLYRTVGSNPTLSANIHIALHAIVRRLQKTVHRSFCFWRYPTVQLKVKR